MSNVSKTSLVNMKLITRTTTTKSDYYHIKITL